MPLLQVAEFNALPDVPPEFAVVIAVPFVPPSNEFESSSVDCDGVVAVTGSDAGPGPVELLATTWYQYCVVCDTDLSA